MQAELFVLRLSRNSGVLGLAGTAFVSQLFAPNLKYDGDNFSRYGVILVRPMLEFSKDDMYKVNHDLMIFRISLAFYLRSLILLLSFKYSQYFTIRHLI